MSRCPRQLHNDKVITWIILAPKLHVLLRPLHASLPCEFVWSNAGFLFSLHLSSHWLFILVVIICAGIGCKRKQFLEMSLQLFYHLTTTFCHQGFKQLNFFFSSCTCRKCTMKDSSWLDGIIINKTAIKDMSLSEDAAFFQIFKIQVATPSLNCPPFSQWLTDQRGKFSHGVQPFAGTSFLFLFQSYTWHIMVSRDLLPLFQVGTDTYTLTVKHGGKM